jgi:hypothetical protein
MASHLLYETLSAWNDAMSLQQRTPAPEAALAALKSALGAQLSRTTVAGYIESCEPVLESPAFVIDAEHLSISQLDRLQPAAWRFILAHQGNPCAICDVTKANGSYQLSMATADEARAREVLTVVRIASDALVSQGRHGPFVLRFFEAPAFYFRALWLHGDPDLFMVTRENTPDERGILVPAQDFLEIFNTMRSTKLRNRVFLEYKNEPEIVASRNRPSER